MHAQLRWAQEPKAFRVPALGQARVHSSSLHCLVGSAQPTTLAMGCAAYTRVEAVPGNGSPNPMTRQRSFKEECCKAAAEICTQGACLPTEEPPEPNTIKKRLAKLAAITVLFV